MRLETIGEINEEVGCEAIQRQHLIYSTLKWPTLSILIGGHGITSLRRAVLNDLSEIE